MMINDDRTCVTKEYSILAASIVGQNSLVIQTTVHIQPAIDEPGHEKNTH